MCSAVWWAAFTYKYEDGEESEDVAQPAHVLAGGPGVPRHGALTAPCRHTSPSHWPHSGGVSQLVIYRQCIVLTRLLISWISPFVIADWNKRQDYIMVRWQGKKICAKFFMNLDSNAHYYIVSTGHHHKPVPLHVVWCATCHVSRVTALSSGSRLSEVTVVAGRGHWRGQTRRVRTMRCTLHAVSHIYNI